MPVPPSQTGIINDALARLGSLERITSIDGASAVARQAKAVWDGELRYLVGDHPWNFAIERALLNESFPAPAHGWLHAYQLPADCFRWLPPDMEDCEHWYEGVEEGGRVLTDAEAPLAVRYISNAKLDDWAHWPPAFVKAMTLLLAAALCEAVSGSQSTRDRLLGEADEAVRNAKRRDALASGNRSRRAVTARSNWLSAQRTPATRARR